MSLFRDEVFANRNQRVSGSIILSQPLSTRIFVAALFGIIGFVAIWFTFGSYTRSETVLGVLNTNLPSAKVLAQRSGVVTMVFVTEGQHVEKGEPLIAINTDRVADTGAGVVEQRLGTLKARKELSEAQIGLENERAKAERERLNGMIEASQTQSESLRNQLQLESEIVDSNQEIYDRVSEVIDRGFISKVEYERKHQTLLSSQQTLANLQQRLIANVAEEQEARSQLASVNFNQQRDISQIKSGLEALAAEQAQLTGEKSYVIAAPIKGTVTAISTGSGKGIATGKAILVIVPERAQLHAELYAPSKAIGFVRVGQESRLLYDAFPYQKFGSSHGEVISISRIAIDPMEADIPFPFEEPVYRIKVQLQKQDVEAFGERIPLQPGMTLQANLVLDRQSFYSWLIQPLHAVLNRNS